jgi:hypothetical protein
MSDKIFGTYGDTTTLKQQFESCSYGDFTITNDYGFDLGDAVEKAPGVIEVEIGISLVTSTRNQIQELSDLLFVVIIVIPTCYLDLERISLTSNELICIHISLQNSYSEPPEQPPKKPLVDHSLVPLITSCLVSRIVMEMIVGGQRMVESILGMNNVSYVLYACHYIVN